MQPMTEQVYRSPLSLRWAALFCLCTAACTPQGDGLERRSGRPADGVEVGSTLIVDTENLSIVGVQIGMTESELLTLGFDHRLEYSREEGDDYKVYHIRGSDNADIQATLNLENIIARIETVSPIVRGPYGLGVGSSIDELSRAYPDGRLIVGEEHNRFATFVTGTPLLFRFDPDDFPEVCFDVHAQCPDNPDALVARLSLSQYIAR